jgi:hypothetical protein
VHYERNKAEFDVEPVTTLTFELIQKSAAARQSADGDVYKVDAICAKIPEQLGSSEHGIHRWCCSNFKNVSKIMRNCASTNSNNDNESDGNPSPIKVKSISPPI